MNENNSQATDTDITATKGVIGRLARPTLALALIPSLIVSAWLIAVREPLIRRDAGNAVARVVATARAELVSHYVDDLIQRAEALIAAIPPDAPSGPANPINYGFPDAVAIHLIPLDEMGTIDLAPGIQGVSSHIGVDVVRRAFNGERPQPEAVLTRGAPHVLVARPYGAPPAGVALVELPHSRLSGLFSQNLAEGEYQLIQPLSNGDAQVVAGRIVTKPMATATVDGTGWRVEFSPSNTWLDSVVPSWWPLVAAMVLIILAVAGALALALFSMQRLLKLDTTTIAEAANSRGNIQLQLAELVSVARQVRQLATKNRQKVANRLRSNLENNKESTSEAAAVYQDRANRSDSATHDQAPERELGGAPADSQDDDLPTHIFKSDCIRGHAETELTDELVEQIGFAIALLASQKNVQTLALGHDCRPSSKRLRTQLIKALLASGIDVIDLGEVPTPLANYATHNSTAESCVVITGSHSPSAINGFKIWLHQQPLSSEDMRALLSNIRGGRRLQGAGRTSKEDMASRYIDQMTLDISLALPLKLVIDCDFGTSARLAPALFEALDCEVITFNHPGDGTRDPDWNLTAALIALGARVRESGADVGVLFDSDSDRLHTVTETGRAVGADQLFMLLAQDVLVRNPGADIVHDIAFTKHFGAFVTRQGGRAIQTAYSSLAIREQLAATDALLGGSFGGHMTFVDRWYNFEDALYALARLAELLSAASSSYEGLISALPKSVTTPELYIPLPADGARRAITKLINFSGFSDGRVTTLDGVRVDYPYGWGLVRYADVDEALALRFEGDDQTGLEKIQLAFREALHQTTPDLTLPF